jgi:hypothetical protein
MHQTTYDIVKVGLFSLFFFKKKTTLHIFIGHCHVPLLFLCPAPLVTAQIGSKEILGKVVKMGRYIL